MTSFNSAFLDGVLTEDLWAQPPSITEATGHKSWLIICCMFDLCFVGGGKMASAILSGIIESSNVEGRSIHVSEKFEPARKAIADRFPGVSVSSSPEPAATFLLAVKPKDAASATSELEILANSRLLGAAKPPVLVSIVAGIDSAHLSSWAPSFTIVRTMPNTAVAVGKGVVALAAGKGADEDAMDRAESLFSAVAVTIRVLEYQMDAVTAMSGSGPAYFMYFIEALEEAGISLGLPLDLARKLAILTTLGSAHLALEDGRDPRILRLEVTSPGGTTAKAIAEFDRGALKATIANAVSAAYERSKELGS